MASALFFSAQTGTAVALSDATVVLDSETEAAIFERLQQELAGRTLFCSLSRTRLAGTFDRILVMEQGRLVDQGRYSELRQRGSPPAALVAAE